MKCRKCGSVKHRNKQGRLWCSPCNTITCKNWRKDHSEELHVINRRAHLKARYGSYYELYGIPVGVEFKNYLANPPAGQAMRKKEGRKSTLDGWSLQECAMQ